MDGLSLLIFRFGGYSALKKNSGDFNCDDILQFVCSKWEELLSCKFIMSYSLGEYGKCLLKSDEDIQLMQLLAAELNVQKVEIYIEKQVPVAFQCYVNRAESSNVRETEVVVNRLESSDARQTELVVDRAESSNATQTEVVEYNASSFSDSTVVTSKSKVLLSSGWGKLIKGVGQIFEGGAREFRKYLAMFAYEKEFEYKFLKNNKCKVKAVCIHAESRHCGWKIHAKSNPINEFFHIKTFISEHSCCPEKFKSNSLKKKMGSNIVSELMVDDVQMRPTMTPNDVVDQMYNKYGVNISYRVAWTALHLSRTAVFGDYNSSYAQIEPYFAELCRTNPASVVHLDKDETNNIFRRCFFAFGGCLEGFKCCRPLLFLDGTFLKGKYKGILLSAVAKDADNGLFPVAFAVVSEENDSNWLYFIEWLKVAVGTDRVLSFISDRHHGIIEGLKTVFSDCHHAFCLVHLQRNLKDKVTGLTSEDRDGVLQEFYACGYECSKQVFVDRIEKLKVKGGKKCAKWITDLPFKHWSSAYFEGCRYRELTNNAAESFNNQISNIRYLPVTKMIDGIRCLLMTQMSTRFENALNWKSVCCPNADTELGQLKNIGRPWKLKKCTDLIYEVLSTPPAVVDIKEKSCSCRQWKINGFPCAHAACVLVNKVSDPYVYIQPYFYVKEYRKTYSSPIYPFIYNDVDKVGSLGPPKHVSKRGRPKVKRMRSRGERKGRKKRKCGKCGEMSYHNKNSCTKDI